MTVRSRLWTVLLPFGVTLMSAAALAQRPVPAASGAPALTAEQKAFVEARGKEVRRQANPQAARIRGVAAGVSVGVRCAEGFVERQRIVPSAADVEIVATTRTDCEGQQCRGLEVTARRAEGPFDLDVDIVCSGG